MSRALRLVIVGFQEPYHAPVWAALAPHVALGSVEVVFGAVPPRLLSGTRHRLHRFLDLSMRADYGVDVARLRPLDAPLLESLAGVESVFLRMADRLEMAAPTSYAARKELFLRHVRYWNHALSEGVDAAIFSNIPHETYDFVLAEMCRLRDVPTLFFHQTQVEDTFLSFEDWREPIPNAGERLRELEAEPTRGVEDGLTGRFLAHMRRQTGADATPFYMQGAAPTVRDRVRAFTRLGAPSTWLRRAYPRYLRARAEQETRSLRREYDRLASVPDLDRPYVYAPLHYQPELTTRRWLARSSIKGSPSRCSPPRFLAACGFT